MNGDVGIHVYTPCKTLWKQEVLLASCVTPPYITCDCLMVLLRELVRQARVYNSLGNIFKQPCTSVWNIVM